MRKYIGIAGLILAGVLCGDAVAAVITFEPPGNVASDLPYEEDGYTIFADAPSAFIETDGVTER